MSLLSIDQLSREDIDSLFMLAQQIEQGDVHPQSAQDKILIPLFFEPSTRTRLSFETAMLRLGERILPVPETSGLAMAKGESLQDTLTVISSFGDIIVMRHPDESALSQADNIVSVPIINGGNGCDEHPTQTLLDLYTIQQETGRIDGLSVGLVGDLKHARVMHSLIKGLSLYDVNLCLVSPEELRAPAHLVTQLQQRQSTYCEMSDLNAVLPELDIIYIVMLQHHRIADPQIVEKLKQQYYRITPEFLTHAKPDVRILHPLVRRDEVSPEVDRLPNAAYFRQAANGVCVRMALLTQMLDDVKKAL